MLFYAEFESVNILRLQRMTFLFLSTFKVPLRKKKTHRFDSKNIIRKSKIAISKLIVLKIQHEICKVYVYDHRLRLCHPFVVNGRKVIIHLRFSRRILSACEQASGEDGKKIG